MASVRVIMTEPELQKRLRRTIPTISCGMKGITVYFVLAGDDARRGWSGWKPKNGSAVRVETYLSEQFTSYAVLCIGNAEFAITFNGNAEAIAAATATGRICILKSMLDMHSKARHTGLSAFLTKTEGKKLFKDLLAWRRMQDARVERSKARKMLEVKADAKSGDSGRVVQGTEDLHDTPGERAPVHLPTDESGDSKP
jgi:hypothetical protein